MMITVSGSISATNVSYIVMNYDFVMCLKFAYVPISIFERTEFARDAIVYVKTILTVCKY